jgi:hypothetical protein
MIISMPTTTRLQQHYDHRLRNLVQRTGDVTVAIRPRSPSLDGAWVAWHDADGGDRSGCSRPH